MLEAATKSTEQSMKFECNPKLKLELKPRYVRRCGLSSSFSLELHIELITDTPSC